MDSHASFAKVLALLEVIAVRFAVVPLLILGINNFFPNFENWQTSTLGFPFPVFGDVVMVSAVLGIMLLRRKRLADYGLTLHNLKYQLDIAAACFLPVVVAGFPMGMGVDYKSWDGALILAVVQITLLFLLGWLLRKKPSVGSASVLASGTMLIFPLLPVNNSTFGTALVLFLTYALFVAFGEEVIYRGYMQSRLNEVFGKPFHFFGVWFGWGLMLTALLFGLTHVGLVSLLFGLSAEVTWAWGLWTFFGGLVFGFVREKSGGILAPALLHGLPQAIAVTAMLMF